jgi:Ca-activated chloride channel family protein
LIVFLTDGLPTINVTEPDEILKNVANKNTRRVRLFVFGVGHDVNTRLLDLLAEQNRGTRDYVEPGEDLELRLSSFYRKVADPVLADLTLTFTALSVYDLYPPKLGDLFSGSELVVVGRYSGAGNRAVELTGTRRGQTERFVYETTFPSESRANDFLPRLWATRKIGYLLDEMRLHGENKELKDTVVQLATKYGIVTPYTAYLVTEPDRVAWHRGRAGGRGGTNVAAQAFDGFVVGDSEAEATFAMNLDAASLHGAAAVGQSQRAKTLREAAVVPPVPASLDVFLGAGDEIEERSSAPLLQHVGTRTFYWLGDRWVDGDFDQDTETKKVELFSEEYFDLVRKHPELAKCFALGERVIVVLNNTAYETVPAP